jgi:hypothetical protein
MAKQTEREHVHYHADGTVWARGTMRGEVMSGYWEWFRKDGTQMRSGYFEDGEQVGEWTTYDKTGAIYKLTVMKPKGAKTAEGKVAATKVGKKKAAKRVTGKAAKKVVKKAVNRRARKAT